MPGAIQLDTMDVSGGRVSAAHAPYSTPAPVSHISRETIEHFRGSSVTAAAHLFNVRQPIVSKRIMEAEIELKVKLFECSTARV